MDASAVSWVLAGNELTPLPEPIRDRLTVIEVPLLSRAHLASVTASIYAEANATFADHFHPDLDPDVLTFLLAMTPRRIRKALQDGMVRAASQGRQRIAVEDLLSSEPKSFRRIGF